MKEIIEDHAIPAAIIILFLVVASLCGCCSTTIEYSKKDGGEVTYSIRRRDHWMKTSASGISGGMTEDGRFEFCADGMEKSPSEEFNRTMKTYTTAFIQLAQIAAAAYNPSASAAAGNSWSSRLAFEDGKIQAPIQTQDSNSTTASQAAKAAGDCAEGNCEERN